MAENSESLQKQLGLLEVYAVATGATLATFFLLPGLAAAEAGPALVLAFLVAAVPLLPGILSKVELMTALPRAGGVYYFMDRSMGPLVGTIGGLGTWLVLMLKVCFALVGMGAYVELFLPGLPIVPVAVGLAVFVGVMNLRGAKLTGSVQVAFVMVILAILLVFAGRGLTEVDPARFRGFFDSGARSLLATAGLVFVGYAGLTKPAAVAEEVENPERNLALGVFLAFGSAVAIYAVGTALIVGVVPMDELRGSLTTVASAGGEVFGPWGVAVLSVAALLAFAAIGNAGTLSASRYPLAMSRDGILPSAFEKLNAKGMPSISIQVTVGAMILIIVFLDPMDIAKLASAFQLLVFSLLCLAVVVMRESGIEEYDPSYRAPVYPWTQVVGIVAPWVLIVGMGWLSVLFSLGMVLAAAIWYRRYARDAVTREGAVYHIFERLGRRRHEGLEREFREILKEKGLREEDPYLEMVAGARVIDLADAAELAGEPVGERRFEDVVRLASEALAESVPSSADALAATFLEEVELGVTPVAHGAALLHVRLRGLAEPELIVIRSVSGVRVGENGDALGGPPGDGDRAVASALSEEGDAGRPGAGQRVHAVFFLASPEEDPRQHLRLLAKLADHVGEEDFRERWLGLGTRDPQDLKSILLHEERALSLEVAGEGPTGGLVGRTLREADLTDRALVALLRRDGEVLDADGETVLRDGDRLTLLGKPSVIDRLRRRYGAS